MVSFLLQGPKYGRVGAAIVSSLPWGVTNMARSLLSDSHLRKMHVAGFKQPFVTFMLWGPQYGKGYATKCIPFDLVTTVQLG